MSEDTNTQNTVSDDFKRQLLRNASVGYESFQDIRIPSKNRIRDIVRKRLEGIAFDEVEEKKEGKDFKKKYTDNELMTLWEKGFKEGKITKEEHQFIKKEWEIAEDTHRLEKAYKRQMLKLLKKDPIFTGFLSKIRGIGEVISAKLIKEFGNCQAHIYEIIKKGKKTELLFRAKEGEELFEFYFQQAEQKDIKDKYKIKGYVTVSRLWSHTGNGVVGGVAVKRRKGQSTSYSPKLKTFTWQISDSLMKLNKGFYRRLYDEEKVKQQAKLYPKGYLKENFNGYKQEDQKLRKGHIHARALRKIRKVFLDHYWHFVRQLSGLPAKKNYIEGVLNHKHIVTWQQALEEENTYEPILATKKEKKEESEESQDETQDKAKAEV